MQLQSNPTHPSTGARPWACLLLLGAAGLLPRQAAAQEFEEGFNAHGFRLAAWDGDPRDLLTVQRPGRMNQGEWFAGGLFEYAESPLVFDYDNGGSKAYLDDIFALNASLGVAPVDFLRFDLSVPLFFTSKGGDENHGVDLSDMRLSAMVGLIRPKVREGTKGGGFGLGLIPFMDIPTGDSSQFVGDGGLGGGIKAAATYEAGPVTVTGDVGTRFGKGVDVVNVHTGSALTAGLGLGVLATPNTGINVEGHLTPTFQPYDVAGTGTPAEILLSLNQRTKKGLHFTAGGAAGLSKGVGAASYRVFLGLGYGKIGPHIPKDTDGDGIIDKVDACITEPETFNKWKDVDGCPDELGKIAVLVTLDGKALAQAQVEISGADGARSKSVSTWEPYVFEAMPGSGWTAFAEYGSCLGGEGQAEATEGRVDLLIPMDVNREAVVAYFVHEEDGTPIPNADVTYSSETLECLPTTDLVTREDGKGAHQVGAGRHTIVTRAEGYAIDRRAITVLPNEKQLVDITLKTTRIKMEEKQIVILEKVYFETAKAVIKPQSFELLNEVATTIVANPQIGRVEVQGHTDNRGNDQYNMDLSDARAKAVRDYLIGQGVPPERLAARGYGETTPIQTNNTETGRAQNRRVEFRIMASDSGQGGAQ